MAELTVGMQVKLKGGATCTVKKELGRGGQGIVYLVSYNGKDYALKWYIKTYSDAFYENLERNVKRTAPSDTFLWPEAITERQYDSFGYLMKLRPSGYEEIGAFMLAKVKFANVHCLLNACLQICTAFQKLHIYGLSYQDMNDGNFFINPQNGDVLICDNDNVAPDKTNMGIVGKAGFIAPEIVEGETLPNKYTDYFSLSVVLFILFYLNRPFEGAKALACPCLNEDADKKLNGKSSVFILDPTDKSNQPVKGVHTNVIRRWPLFPRILREAFIKTFSKEAIQNPTKRLMDKTWQEILIQVRSLYVKCPACGQYTFVDIEQTSSTCIECGKVLNRPPLLSFRSNAMPLVPGQKIYLCQVSTEYKDFNEVVGECIRNTIDPSKWGLRNHSNIPWTVTTPEREVKLVNGGTGMPILPGLEIRFTKEETGVIK